MKFTRSAKFALATAASVALAFTVLTPAQASTRTTVTMVVPADITSLNSGTSDGNTSYNAIVGSLTGMGYSYYDADAKLVMNTKFGSMQIVRKAAKDFQIRYTVAPGQHWSDGLQLMLSIYFCLTSFSQINIQKKQDLVIQQITR
jgi:peptide/nickel transport system substrate-binding protein